MIGHFGREKCPRALGSAKRGQARPRQMVAYSSVHCHDERSEPSIGIPATLVHNDRQRGERRFQPMRKIGDVTAGPLEIECILIKKRIEFCDKGRDFAWLCAMYPLFSPRADPLQVFS